MRLDAEVSVGRSLVWPLGAAVLSVTLLVFVAFQTAVTTATFLAIGVLLTALSFLALTRGAPPGKPARHRIGADARGLMIDGQLLVPRQTLARARVADGKGLGGRHSVVIETRGFAPSRIVHVESARIAQALADALEPSPHDVAMFEALPPWAHRMRWLAIVLTTSPWILFNLLRHMPGWTILVVLALYLVIALPMVLPQKIAVGEDGVLLRWAGRRRFVPFAMLREVRATPLGVELELANERTIEVRFAHRPDAEVSRRTALLARIEEGLATHRALGPAEDEAMLLRGERDVDIWLEAMTAIGASDAHDYRTLAIPRERLWAVVENPAAKPSARQGAALALRARLDDEELERLLAIAQKSASPRLRVAIDAVARAPDEPRLRVALEEALDDDDDDDSAELPPRAARRN